MADYYTVAELKAENPDSGFNASSDYDTALGAFITSASRAIDKEIGKWDNYFYPATDGETRYFDGTGTRELWVDDIVSLTSVSVSEEGGLASSDYTLWSSSDYILTPYNSTPKSILLVDTLNGSKLYWEPYLKAVKIVAVFGYSSSPPQVIKQACSIQALRWFQRAKQNWQDSGAKSDFGQVAISSKLDPDVAALLHPFKLRALAEL
jgi:hypothetical protein